MGRGRPFGASLVTAGHLDRVRVRVGVRGRGRGRGRVDVRVRLAACGPAGKASRVHLTRALALTLALTRAVTLAATPLSYRSPASSASRRARAPRSA